MAELTVKHEIIWLNILAKLNLISALILPALFIYKAEEMIIFFDDDMKLIAIFSMLYLIEGIFFFRGMYYRTRAINLKSEYDIS